MQAGFLHLYVTLLLHWALNLNQLQFYILGVDWSLSQCSKHKQVQNDDSTVVILLAELVIQVTIIYLILIEIKA